MPSFDIKKLNTSSYKGIPFFTKATDLTGGKKITTHNFINSGNEAEDNGLANKNFKITGYLGGENYQDDRDNLIAAFDTPGSGTLVDMFYGTLEVFIKTYTIKEEKTKFGQATLEMTFEKKENKIFVEDLIIYNLDYTEEVMTNFETEFNNTLGAEMMNEVSIGVAKYLKSVNDTIKFLEGNKAALQNIKNTIGKTISTIKTSILSIDSLSADIVAIATSFDTVTDLNLFGADGGKSFSNSVKENILNASTLTSENVGQESANKQTKIYTYALGALLTQTVIKNLENIDYETGDDFGSVKSDVLDIFEILEKDITTNLNDKIDNIVNRQNLLDSYHESRKECIIFYTQKYSGLQNLKDNELVATTDVLNLTLDKYNDIERVNEVIINNNIVDPLFINGTLKLLDR